MLCNFSPQTKLYVIMKKLMLAVMAVALLNGANAQFIKRMADRAKNKLEQRAGQQVDKEVDDAVDEATKKKDKPAETKPEPKKQSSNTAPTNSGSNAASKETGEESAASAEAPALTAYSKYDFIPGEKMIAWEDFKSAAVGDFPERWNTNATAEVVTLNNKEGKWLKLAKKGNFHPEFITELPENFTLEFDLGVNDGWNSYPFAINFAKFKDADDYLQYGYNTTWSYEHVVHLNFKPAVNSSKTDGNSSLQTGGQGKTGLYNNASYNTWDNKTNKFAHISIWRQKQRLRVYLNGEKIWDIPKAFDANTAYNAVGTGITSMYNDNDFFVFSNLRLAVGAPDTRNKLITEGKFVTRGILFDVNSDVVKPESYGTIKDIANVLKENADVKVKVIGHTDSDGDDKANLELSKKRAASVKAALVSEFGIDGGRIETDGKGESQPVDKSETSVGKANNRRVEFIKL